jgi:hypothetical protein
MSEFLRRFTSSLQDPDAQSPDDASAQAQTDPNSAATDAPPAASDAPAQADPAPVLFADNSPPPAHEDPIVGQNKAVDPNEKSGCITGTLDTGKGPKVTGFCVDPPNVGPLKPGGDPLKYPPDKPDNPANGGSPPLDRGPGWKWVPELLQWVPVPCPPGPGYKWDKTSQSWKNVPSPGDGYTWDYEIHDWVKAPEPKASVASATILFFGSPNPSLPGQSVTWTAQVMLPDGTPAPGAVTFDATGGSGGLRLLGRVPLTDGTASVTAPLSGVGAYWIKATYPGWGNITGSYSEKQHEVKPPPES